MKTVAALLLLLSICVVLLATQFSKADISNGIVSASLNLPDRDSGFYRATRFDWGGTIVNLGYKGHTFFAPWFKRHDPSLQDTEFRKARALRLEGHGILEPGYIAGLGFFGSRQS
jgi:hypothetical protein